MNVLLAKTTKFVKSRRSQYSALIGTHIVERYMRKHNDDYAGFTRQELDVVQALLDLMKKQADQHHLLQVTTTLVVDVVDPYESS